MIDIGPAEEAFERFRSLHTNNPAYQELYLHLIKACQEEQERSCAVASLDEFDRPKTATQSSQQIVTMLIECGVIEQRIVVDGELYAGDETLLAEDESIPDDALIQYFVHTTEAGMRALEEFDPLKRIAGLFASKPQHARAFSLVLQACSHEPKTQRAIEKLFEGDADALKLDPVMGLPRVYPAYFTGALEQAGALVWKGTWRTTSEGMAFIEENA